MVDGVRSVGLVGAFGVDSGGLTAAPTRSARNDQYGHVVVVIGSAGHHSASLCAVIRAFVPFALPFARSVQVVSIARRLSMAFSIAPKLMDILKTTITHSSIIRTDSRKAAPNTRDTKYPKQAPVFESIQSAHVSCVRPDESP